MRTSIALLLSLALAACGGSDKKDPTTPEPDTTEEPTEEPDQPPAMMTPDECDAAGGTVVGDIGDGSVQCPEGMFESGNVSGGVEEQLCCTPMPPDAE